MPTPAPYNTTNIPGEYGATYNTAIGWKLPIYSRLVDEAGQPAPIDIRFRPWYTDTVGNGLLHDWKYRPLQELHNNDNTNESHANLFGVAF